MKAKYLFDPEYIVHKIQYTAHQWQCSNGLRNKWVIGISGGKDSTIVADIFSKKFGKENVIGVLMPCGDQADIDDSHEVISVTGIQPVTINIVSACQRIREDLKTNDTILKNVHVGDYGNNERVADTNLPPRIRMTTLYYIAQIVGGIVLNTSNLSESILGYGTLYGDIAGSFAPIRDLTATEVIALGDYLHLPRFLVHKTPADGLSGKTDEDNLGVKYADVDRYIRLGSSSANKDVIDIVEKRYNANKFKSEIINIPGVPFWEFPNYVTGYGGDLDMYEMIKEARR